MLPCKLVDSVRLSPLAHVIVVVPCLHSLTHLIALTPGGDRPGGRLSTAEQIHSRTNVRLGPIAAKVARANRWCRITGAARCRNNNKNLQLPATRIDRTYCTLAHIHAVIIMVAGQTNRSAAQFRLENRAMFVFIAPWHKRARPLWPAWEHNL